MCDKPHFEELEDRVTKMETAYAVTGEQIKNLVKSVDRLTHVVYAFTFILLLAVVYGALGSTGFNAVTNAAKISPSEVR